MYVFLLQTERADMQLSSPNICDSCLNLPHMCKFVNNNKMEEASCFKRSSEACRDCCVDSSISYSDDDFRKNDDLLHIRHRLTSQRSFTYSSQNSLLDLKPKHQVRRQENKSNFMYNSTYPLSITKEYFFWIGNFECVYYILYIHYNVWWNRNVSELEYTVCT